MGERELDREEEREKRGRKGRGKRGEESAKGCLLDEEWRKGVDFGRELAGWIGRNERRVVFPRGSLPSPIYSIFLPFYIYCLRTTA